MGIEIIVDSGLRQRRGLDVWVEEADGVPVVGFVASLETEREAYGVVGEGFGYCQVGEEVVVSGKGVNGS